LSEYLDYNNYEACTTTTQEGDDSKAEQRLQIQPSTARLYGKPAAVPGSDAIDRVMECNDLTQTDAVQ